jgi:hypothetical protein
MLTSKKSFENPSEDFAILGSVFSPVFDYEEKSFSSCVIHKITKKIVVFPFAMEFDEELEFFWCNILFVDTFIGEFGRHQQSVSYGWIPDFEIAPLYHF